MKRMFTLLLIIGPTLLFAQQKLSFIRPSDVLNSLYEYTGEVKDGKANGYGEATGRFDSYKGYWKDNDFHGKGTLSNDKGIEYEGDFENGKMHGKGTRYYYSGVIHTGEFVKGFRTGYGKSTYPDGKIEEGYFFENEFLGTKPAPGPTQVQVKKEHLWFTIPYQKNTYLKSQISYTGEVKDGMANGYGEADIRLTGNYQTNELYAKYKGYWKDNYHHGKGTLIFTSGSKYEGDFVNGQPYGKGTYTYEGGGNYTGDFVNGERQGQGVMTYRDGSKDEGKWVSDQFRGDGNKIPDTYVSTKKTNDEVSVEEKAKPVSSTRAPNEMFYASESDYANVDWDALGRRKAEPGYTTGQHIAFLEEVSKDVRKYLDETFTKNGSTYKRYGRSREAEGNYRIYNGQQVSLTGKTTSILILSYCQNFGPNAKAKVTMSYGDNGKKDNKTVLTGASCNVITDCGNKICKTTCSGAIEVDFANSTHALWLERQGTWNGLEKVYWVVLTDQQQ
jgi:hypothetical protein